MTTLYEKIRALLEEEHPTVVVSEDGVESYIAGKEREKLLDEWAQSRVDQFFSNLRQKRDFLLSASDWVALFDVPLTEEQRKAWVEYRQALRDLPETIEDPTAEIRWPEPPGGNK